MELTLTTELQGKAKELIALREKQAGYFSAIKSADSPDERSALKLQAEAGLREIEAKAVEYEGDLSLAQSEQANAEAIKSMGQVVNRRAFSAGGNYGGDETAFEGKSLGQLVTESGEFKSGVPGIKSAPFNIELKGADIPALLDPAIKATMTTGAGWAPYGPRMPGYIPSAIRTPAFADLIPQANTQSPIFYYMEETTFTNNAAYVAEGATKPESAFALTSRTVQAAKIATTLPVSEELLEDIPQIQEYLNNRGMLQIELAEEDALLNFTSGANGWDGFLQKAGVQTQAVGVDPAPTAILKAMTKVQYSPGFAGIATGIAINPIDWQNILTLQETTGAYIFSMPSAPNQMPDMRIWGLTVRPVVALTQGTAVLGNYRMFSQIWRRAGLSIRMAYANDDAIKNLVRMIFEERLALQITRSAAFCKVTGLPA